MMTIVFLSNYFNHHQSSFSDALFNTNGIDYRFIAYESVDAERAAMGWQTDHFPEYVLQYHDDPEKCDDFINNADVVIFGSAPARLVEARLKKNKITLAYSERIDKIEPGVVKFLKSFVRLNLNYKGRSNAYYLCASAFASHDITKRLLFKDRCYKWGYFPKAKKYDDIQSVLELKRSEEVSILFASRLIDWKHPELPVKAAIRLKDDGIKFHLTMIGIGSMEEDIHRMIEEYRLQNEITHIKAMTPEDVRKHMEQSAVFLFTSDRQEGWGAVLNEAMNSGCAIVASSEIGSVPFLLRNEENGYIYQDGNFEEFYRKTKELCLNREKRERFGFEAYNTIQNVWNAECAAERLVQLIGDLQDKGASDRFSEGPCSRAEILMDSWFEKHRN